MNIFTFADAQNDLRKILDSVANDIEYATITEGESNDVVVMSRRSFDGLMETLYLLKSPTNAMRLEQSIEQYKQNKVVKHEINL